MVEKKMKLIIDQIQSPKILALQLIRPEVYLRVIREISTSTQGVHLKNKRQ